MNRYRSSTAIRSVGLLILAWAFYSLLAQSGAGNLTVDIRDRETGHSVPAMVCITSLEDNKWRVPPDGRVAPPYSRVPDFYDPKDWKPGDTGPVRLTAGDWGDNQTRSFVYNGQSSYPFWGEPAAYFVSRPFSIQLPAGRWRLAVARGIEYLPVFQEFTIKPGENLDQRIDLQRWVSMAKNGWYSGDDHVHYPRTKPWHNEFLLTWAQAEEVYVLTSLQQRVLPGRLTFPQGDPENFRFERDGYVLATGQEDPSTEIDQLGHSLALNIKQPFFDLPRFHLYDVMFDAIRAQGGLTGYAHISWAPEWYRREASSPHATWDSTLNVIQGKIDFFEIMQFRRLGLEDYYDFLNMGVKLAASAGSDMPWGSSIGESRVYAYTGQPFSGDAWFAAFRQGKTFVTNGPMISLQLNGAGPGEDLNVSPNDSVRIQARAWAPQIIGSPNKLEVLAHGKVIRTALASSPDQQELQLDFSIPAKQSQWIAARVSTHNGGLAHTSPVYVMVDGQKFWDREQLPNLVNKRLEILDFARERLKDQKYTASYAPGEVEALIDRIEAARKRYQDLLASN
ncbi:MAG: CehA/McbA family metallohydrolase [Bryobacterales bacterium]